MPTFFRRGFAPAEPPHSGYDTLRTPSFFYHPHAFPFTTPMRYAELIISSAGVWGRTPSPPQITFTNSRRLQTLRRGFAPAEPPHLGYDILRTPNFFYHPHAPPFTTPMRCAEEIISSAGVWGRAPNNPQNHLHRQTNIANIAEGLRPCRATPLRVGYPENPEFFIILTHSLLQHP